MSDVTLFTHSSKSMHEMEDSSVSLIVTSPPYFPDETYSELCTGGFDYASKLKLSKAIVDYARSQRAVFAECFRVLVPGGHLICQTRDVRLEAKLVAVESEHRYAIEAAGFELVTRHFWRPIRTSLAKKNAAKKLCQLEGHAAPDPEVFLVFKRPGETYLGKPSDEDATLLMSNFMVTDNRSMKASHHFRAPQRILEAFIRQYSNVGDTVLDPYAGGGTTAVVARKLNRNSFLYEIDLESIKLIRSNVGKMLKEIA